MTDKELCHWYKNLQASAKRLKHELIDAGITGINKNINRMNGHELIEYYDHLCDIQATL